MWPRNPTCIYSGETKIHSAVNLCTCSHAPKDSGDRPGPMQTPSDMQGQGSRGASMQWDAALR